MEKKRVNGRFVKSAGEEVSEPVRMPSAVGAPRPKCCRTFARKRLAEAMPEIVEVLVNKAKGGSVAHTKALAELSGLNRREAEAEKPVRRRGKSFVGALLEELGEA